MHLKDLFFWGSYQTNPAKIIDNDKNIYELPSASLQGVGRLFVLAYDATADNEAGIKTIENISFQDEKLKTIMY